MSKYPLTAVSVPPLPGVHGGTGDISSAKNMVVPASVGKDVNTQLDFVFKLYDVTVMSFEIDHSVAPNWFGVAFRKGIDSFDAVNIFFHPHPGSAGMLDTDYLARGGTWPRLFRYAEMLGSQLAIAANNQILVVPFFNNASYPTTGVFAPNWNEIVDDIVTEVWRAAHTHATGKGGSQTLRIPGTSGANLLKNVVLSEFSYGRQIMWVMNNKAPGLKGYLREIWDFNGVGPRVPSTSGTVRAIRYDQSQIRDPSAFHVPAQRWLGYHHKVVNWNSIHGDIPYMLAWHAATVSGVN